MTLCFSPLLFANTDNQAEVAPQAAQASFSHARAVSVTMIHGTVGIRRPESGVWIRATLNAPIEEGFTVATEKDSFAEVQFENGSTLRIGEFSRVEFEQLALAPHVGRISHLNLVVGVATIHLFPERHDEYVVTAVGVSLTSRRKAEFRADLKGGRMRAEVFSGSVQAADSKQSETLGKGRVLTYDYRASGPFQETKTIHLDGWDRWIRQRDREADLAAYRVDDPADTGGLLYGWDDLVPFGGTFPDSSF